jgi:PAS domain S-box-containing protein
MAAETDSSIPTQASWTEAERLAAIDSFGILDTPREPEYDEIAQLAARLCDFPIALVNIVDKDRQWFKAEVGWGIRETSLDDSICKHTILQPGVFIVPDTTRDSRFSSMSFVRGEPRIRFYAGALLQTPEGLPVGTMCVLDYKPRVLTEKDIFTLTTLAHQVMIHLQQRRLLRDKTISEARLIASEISYRRLFEAAQDGILILHAETGRVTDVNPFLEELLGFSREEMIGKTVGELSPFKDLVSNRDMLEKLKRDGFVRYQHLPLETKDGRNVAVEFVSNTYQAGDGKVIQCNIRDITLRKRDEQKIEEQADLLDKARDAIVVRDLEGKILFWNRGAERIYGWSRQDVLGGYVGGLVYTDPQQFEKINALTLSAGEWTGEMEHLTKDRREITTEARWTLIRDQEGNPKSILAIDTDVTEKKRIEAQFMRAQRMESIGTLAGGIAHDLNNILAPIMMSVQVLKTISDHPQAQAILETVEVSAKRGADIVRQVLSFARGLEGERIEVQPKHLLHDLEIIIKETFPKDIQQQFSTPADTWTILGDPTQVHQILLNLCVNARDAMPNGGSLVIDTENCVLDEHYAAMNAGAKAGRYVKFSVSDSGFGIPPNLIDKIFEPFFTTKALNQGTGLGLSTVMAIVKSHEGIIHVYSEPGKGTTFNVYLPAMAVSSDLESEQFEQVNLPRGNGETILIVDDEVSIVTITSQTLEAFGYRVLTATDGAEAVAVYAEQLNQIALVITDMMMPIMDGSATIRALARINPAVKIIAASGLNVSGGLSKPPGQVTKHFLLKPYTASALLKVVRSTLDET